MENNRKLLLPRVLETGRVPQPMRFGIMGSGLNFCLGSRFRLFEALSALAQELLVLPQASSSCVDCFVGLAFAGCVEEA